MKNLQPEEFQISKKFHDFLKTRIEDFEEKKYAQAFEKVDWQKVTREAYESVNSYWQELSETEKRSIGIFDVRWDDASTQYCIEFDYDLDTNDPENAMSEGCIYNKPVIDYSNFIKENLKEEPENIWKTMDDDYSVMQDILCRFSIEVILLTLKNESFAVIPKQKPYYLMFAYYHDEEASIIFDNSNVIEIDLYLYPVIPYKFYIKNVFIKKFYIN
ncbi:Leucine rich repeat protein (fragment) [Leptospira interrogans serovar Manilae]|uniref:Leucine rich repeat protein n=1 Tax=Leptospira interrogans serovar Manilae TaxID=214675 RepID=A0AAQ1NXH4_LEPIR